MLSRTVQRNQIDTRINEIPLNPCFCTLCLGLALRLCGAGPLGGGCGGGGASAILRQVSLLAGYQCICEPGWEGTHCEIGITCYFSVFCANFVGAHKKTPEFGFKCL